MFNIDSLAQTESQHLRPINTSNQAFSTQSPPISSNDGRNLKAPEPESEVKISQMDSINIPVETKRQLNQTEARPRVVKQSKSGASQKLKTRPRRSSALPVPIS